MTVLGAFALLVALGSIFAPAVLAQMPGDPRPRHSYDRMGSTQQAFDCGAPSQTVRQAQQALRAHGFYEGPLDGNASPEFASAIWRCQRANGLRRTARLDWPTVAALDPRAAAAASDPATPPNVAGARLGNASTAWCL